MIEIEQTESFTSDDLRPKVKVTLVFDLEEFQDEKAMQGIGGSASALGHEFLDKLERHRQL